MKEIQGDQILIAIQKLVDEVKKDGWGEVIFKTSIQGGKIVTMVLYKTISVKLT